MCLLIVSHLFCSDDDGEDEDEEAEEDDDVRSMMETMQSLLDEEREGKEGVREGNMYTVHTMIERKEGEHSKKIKFLLIFLRVFRSEVKRIALGGEMTFMN